MRIAMLWLTVVLLWVFALAVAIILAGQGQYGSGLAAVVARLSPAIDPLVEACESACEIALPLACVSLATYLLLIERRLRRAAASGFPVLAAADV